MEQKDKSFELPDPETATVTAAVISLDGKPSSTACPHCGQLLTLVVDLRLADSGRQAEYSSITPREAT